MIERAARFLLVDDTPDDRMLIRLVFRRHGIANPLEEATNGEEALARLRDVDAPPIDVLLLDQGLPDLSGDEVAAAIAAEPRLSGLTILLLSTHGQAALGPGTPKNVRAALEKPLRVDALLRILHQLMGGRTEFRVQTP